MIVFLVGKKGSGKSTCSQYLIDNHNFIKLSFAKPLKECVACLYRVDEKLLDSLEYKETKLAKPWIWNKEKYDQLCAFFCIRADIPIVDRVFNTPREAMQYIGTDILRTIDPNFHINKTKPKIIKANINKQNIVLDDVRFCNERDMLCKYGAIGIYINRPNLLEDSHSSENELNHTMFDKLIKNDGTKEELLVKFKETYRNIYK